MRAGYLTAVISFCVCLTLPSGVHAQKTSADFSAGSVQIGDDNRTCDGSLEGTIRYDNATNEFRFCNGSAWQPMGGSALPDCGNDEYFIQMSSGLSCYTGFPPAGTDNTPNAFSFTDLTDLDPAQLTTSNIIQITGVDTQATVTISGDGTPEFRICADVGCSSVITDWRSGFDTIEYGRYLQLRATSPSYGLTNNVSIGVGTANDTWSLTTRYRIVFVTTSNTNGNIGGLSGADAMCANDASTYGHNGTFYPWLSTSTTSPVARFIQSATPYMLVDGTVVANDWSDLTDGTLTNAITLSAAGSTINSTAYTGTNTDGTDYGGNCSNWTTNSGTSYTYNGTTNTTSSTWTRSGSNNNCSANRYLYCFEQ